MILFDSDGEFINCWVGKKSYESLESEVNSFITSPEDYRLNHENTGACKDPDSLNIDILLIGLSLSVIIAFYFIINSNRKKKNFS
jgi:hypothetical protein